MDITSITTAAYIVASLLFILSLAGLSRHETSRNGLTYGMVGMGIALAATIALTVDVSEFVDDRALIIVLMFGAVGIGAVIGLWRARIVEMTGMPELIALLHSFVGLAAVLIGWNGHVGGAHVGHALAEDVNALINIHEAEVAIGIFIGAVTFTGSIVANLKLSARIKSEPLMLPGKNLINLGSLAAFAVLTALYVGTDAHHDTSADLLLVVLTALALALVGTWSPRSAVATCRSWSRC